MQLVDFLKILKQSPEKIEFNETIALIDAIYEYTPTAFSNGDLDNNVGENEGSCKIFAFGMLNDLSEAHTLYCFGSFYRKDVLRDPEGNNHQNIRNFMKTGWVGIKFETEALKEI